MRPGSCLYASWLQVGCGPLGRAATWQLHQGELGETAARNCCCLQGTLLIGLAMLPWLAICTCLLAG